MTDNGARPGSSDGTSKQRRSGRISRQIPIILIGNDSEGLVFSEEAKMVVLSRYGSGTVPIYKRTAEQELVTVHRWDQTERQKCA